MSDYWVCAAPYWTNSKTLLQVRRVNHEQILDLDLHLLSLPRSPGYKKYTKKTVKHERWNSVIVEVLVDCR